VIPNKDALQAAMRVLNACDAGLWPACDDIWTMQLSVGSRDAPDLLLEPEDLARKIISRRSPIRLSQAAVRA
jgi:hypothetical protein